MSRDPCQKKGPSQQRRAIRRRKAAITGALRYLNEGLAGLPGVRKDTAEKRVRESSQPMSTAKALVKEWNEPAMQSIKVKQWGEGWPG